LTAIMAWMLRFSRESTGTALQAKKINKVNHNKYPIISLKKGKLIIIITIRTIKSKKTKKTPNKKTKTTSTRWI